MIENDARNILQLNYRMNKESGVWLHIFLMFLVLVYTLYCSFLVIFSDHDNILIRVVSLVVFLVTLYFIIKRDTYLPFLGPSALPVSILKENVSPAGSNVEADVVINVPNGTRVIYWGASPEKANKVIPTPQLAYKNYSNAGIAVVQNGKVKFRFFCPVKYQVAWGKTLNRHIHYRIIDSNGMLGRVETVYVNC